MLAPTIKKGTQPKEHGSTLVELVVGMVLSVMAIGSILSMTVHHAKQQKIVQETQLALRACRNNLEELHSIPFSSLPSMNGVGFDVPGRNGAAGGLNAVPGDPDGLPGQFTVTVDQTTGGITIYLVKATVTWTGSLKSQSFEMQTLMGPRQ